MQTELLWQKIEMSRKDPAVWTKHTEEYKVSRTLLVTRNDGTVKKTSLMWRLSDDVIGLFADDFGPTHYALVNGLV